MPNNDKPAILSRKEIERIPIYAPAITKDFSVLCELRDSHIAALDEIEAWMIAAGYNPDFDGDNKPTPESLRRALDQYANDVQTLRARQLPEGWEPMSKPPDTDRDVLVMFCSRSYQPRYCRFTGVWWEARDGLNMYSRLTSRMQQYAVAWKEQSQ